MPNGASAAAGSDSHVGKRFQGLIDEVRISDVALSPSEFLFSSKRQRKN